MQQLLQPQDWKCFIYHKGTISTLVIFVPVSYGQKTLSHNEEDMILSYLTDAEHISYGIFEIDHNEDIAEDLVEYGFEITEDIDPELLMLVKSQNALSEDDIEIDSLTDKGMDICSSCGKCLFVEDLDEFNECSDCRDADEENNISIEDFLY